VKFVAKVVAGTVIVVITLIVIIAACASTGGDAKQSVATAQSTSEQAPTTATEAEAVTPDPNGTDESTCDILLGTGLYDPNYVVADDEIKNTGNVGIVLRVVATWKQAGSGPIRMKKKVRVPYQGQKAVHFKRKASQEQISAFQSAPGYFSETGACSVKSTILDSYGAAH
jgi:hypothetical protein